MPVQAQASPQHELTGLRISALADPVYAEAGAAYLIPLFSVSPGDPDGELGAGIDELYAGERNWALQDDNIAILSQGQRCNCHEAALLTTLRTAPCLFMNRSLGGLCQGLYGQQSHSMPCECSKGWQKVVKMRGQKQIFLPAS